MSKTPSFSEISCRAKGIVDDFQRNNRHLIAFLLIFFLGFLSYFRSFWADFQFDDYEAIVQNPLIKHFNLAAFFSYYKARFLTNLTFALNYRLSGLDVFSWHLASTVIHVIASFFAYLLTFVTLKTPSLDKKFDEETKWFLALFSSLIFLAHPIQTQAVTYLTQRATSLAALFYLGTVYFYVKARQESRMIYYVWTAVFAVFGMFTKPTFVTLPVAILLYDFYFLESKIKMKADRILLFAVVIVPLVTIPFLLLGTKRLAWEAAYAQSSITQRDYLLTQFNVVLTYIRLLFLPVGQNLDYDYKIAHSLFEWPTGFSFLAIIALFAAAVKLFRTWRIASFGILWFLMTLAPQSSFFPLSDVIYEHRMYLAVYGFSILATWALAAAIKNKRAYAAVMSFIIAVLILLTQARNSLWAQPLLFMQDIVKKSPNKARPHNNLGFFYLKSGRLDEAQKEYQKTVEFDPSYYLAWSNLGMVYYEQGRLPEAQKIFEKLINQYPDYPYPFLGLALVLHKQGKGEAAFQFFYQTTQLDPFSAAARIGLGNIYQEKNDLRRAKSAFEQAVWLDPESAPARYNLGNVYFREGNFYEALLSYQKAAVLKPGFAEALNNAGSIYFYFGDFPTAVEYYKKAVSSNALLPEAYLNLANSLYEIGRIEDSRRYAKIALELYRRQGREEMASSIEKKLADQKQDAR